MLRSVRDILKNNAADLRTEAGFAAGIMLLVSAGIFVGLLVAGTPGAHVSAPPILFGVFGGLAILLMAVMGAVRFISEFPMLLQFPLTRRASVAGECAAVALHTLAVEALVFVMGRVIFVLYGQAEAWPALLAEVPWWLWAIPAPLAVVVGLFCGGVVARFGRRGGWVLYFCCLFPMWFASPIIEWFEQFTFTPAQLRAMGIAGIAALAALPLLGLRWLLRAAV